MEFSDLEKKAKKILEEKLKEKAVYRYDESNSRIRICECGHILDTYEHAQCCSKCKKQLVYRAEAYTILPFVLSETKIELHAFCASKKFEKGQCDFLFNHPGVLTFDLRRTDLVRGLEFKNPKNRRKIFRTPRLVNFLTKEEKEIYYSELPNAKTVWLKTGLKEYIEYLDKNNACLTHSLTHYFTFISTIENRKVELLLKSGYEIIATEIINREGEFFYEEYLREIFFDMTSVRELFPFNTEIKKLIVEKTNDVKSFKNIKIIHLANKQKQLSYNEIEKAFDYLNERYEDIYSNEVGKMKYEEYQKEKIYNFLSNHNEINLIELLEYFNRVYDYQGIDYCESIDMLNDLYTMGKEKKLFYKKFPQSLHKEHALMVRQYNLLKKEDEERETQKILDCYLWMECKDKEFSILTPKKAVDIVREGRLLNHCVGSYVNKVIQGKSIIIFLRKTDCIDDPYYTIELSPSDYSLIQIRGKNNCNVPSDEMSFVNKWLSQLKNKLNKKSA